SGTATVTDTAGMHIDNFTIPTAVIDSQGTNHGTYSGPTLGVAGALSSDPDTAVQFDGSNDYATVARQIADDFSIEFWFKSTQGIGTDPGWTQGAGLVDANVSGTNNDFGVSLRADGRVVAGVGGGGGDTSVVSSSSGHNDGDWHHVVFTRTRSTGAFILYVDGVDVGTATNNTAALTASPTLVFGRAAAGGNFYAGSLDEIAIYDTVMAPATVAAHYSAR
ncbi:MAG TPA: LamG domain-containing protein, partial [Euzebya sp.]|nr:LamG domain-containing protein [Euzebya sp.]